MHGDQLRETIRGDLIADRAEVAIHLRTTILTEDLFELRSTQVEEHRLDSVLPTGTPPIEAPVLEQFHRLISELSKGQSD